MYPEKLLEIPERRSVKIRVIAGRTKLAKLANRDIPPGRFGPIHVIAVTNTPHFVTDQEVCRLYALADVGDVLECEFAELIDSRILV
jgi:hypothetical protein